MQEEDVEVEEYYEGRVTEGVVITDPDMTAKFDHEDQLVGEMDPNECFDFDQNEATVSRSRQREEAGARESVAEISPDRPPSSYLSHEQKMTSFKDAP